MSRSFRYTLLTNVCLTLPAVPLGPVNSADRNGKCSLVMIVSVLFLLLSTNLEGSSYASHGPHHEVYMQVYTPAPNETRVFVYPKYGPKCGCRYDPKYGSDHGISH